MSTSEQKLQGSSNYKRPWFLPGSDFDKILAPLYETKESSCSTMVDEEADEYSSEEGESEDEPFDYDENADSDVVFDDNYTPAEEEIVDNQEDKRKNGIKQTLEEVLAMCKKGADKDTFVLTKELCEKNYLEDYPRLWPIENADMMIELGNTFKQLEKPFIAYSFYRCAMESHREHTALKKLHDDILQIVDDLDNKQLKCVYELRDKLCDAISKQQPDSPTTFDWSTSIKNAYPSHVYNTCAIEGNHLSISDVKTLIESGPCFRNSPNKDAARDDAEVIGAHKAFQHLFSEFDGEKHINIEHMRHIHRLLMKGTPKESTSGEFCNECDSLSKEDIPKHVETLMKWLSDELQHGIIDGVSLSVMAHYHLVLLHPFNDGNGRSSRLLMNYVLMRCNFPPVIIPKLKANDYYRVIDIANRGDIRAFVRFTSDCLTDTIKELLQRESPHPSSGTCESSKTIDKSDVEYFRIGPMGIKLIEDSDKSSLSTDGPSRSVTSRSNIESFLSPDNRNVSVPDVNWFKIYANIICNSDNFV
ncbi:fic/DOC family domain-containing protein [Ditylenchus destructor]|uniref:Fic/DOC family domain-containing protein n=1 Tax=Ditylenchus destructor TaxID=166010 RepID=A0AAD4RA13_9BILA|nr:fic/DOC family domain-containing protein [Ditylenchus destructor]